MNESTAPKVVYKRNKYKLRKSDVHDSAKSIAPVIEPTTKLQDKPVVTTTPGRKPDVVRDFAEDPRATKLSDYVMEGLSVREAGIMAGYSSEQLDALEKRSEHFRRHVQKAVIMFKQHHLRVIKDKSDPSTSKWLLEKTFPEEYSGKTNAAGGNGGSTTVIHAIFKSVQATPDNLVPVKVYEHENSDEAEQDNAESQDNRGDEPSLNAGGANIL